MVGQVVSIRDDLVQVTPGVKTGSSIDLIAQFRRLSLLLARLGLADQIEGQVPVNDLSAEGKRLIIVPAGLTQEGLIDFMKVGLGVQIDLRPINGRVIDERLSSRSNERSGYRVWVNNQLSCDFDYINRSVAQLNRDEVSGITLLEWLLLQCLMFMDNGSYIDSEGFCTICSGSPFDDGTYPVVMGSNKREKIGVEVDFCSPIVASEYFGTREVFMCK